MLIPRPSRNFLPAALAAFAILFSGAAAAEVKGAVRINDDKPGVGSNPAFVCFHTTITEQGHTRKSRFVRKSGNPMADRGAMQLMRSLHFLDEGRDKHVEREMHALVKMYGTGFAYRFYEMHEPLPEICSAPPWQRKR